MTNTTELTTDAMLAELATVFPSLTARRLSEFGRDHEHRAGVWTGMDTGHDMPDGLPIFCNSPSDCEAYDGPVHGAFVAWLDARGWTWERYDDTTFFLLPNSAFAEERAAEVCQKAADSAADDERLPL